VVDVVDDKPLGRTPATSSAPTSPTALATPATPPPTSPTALATPATPPPTSPTALATPATTSPTITSTILVFFWPTTPFASAGLTGGGWWIFAASGIANGTGIIGGACGITWAYPVKKCQIIQDFIKFLIGFLCTKIKIIIDWNLPKSTIIW
jgi:hypothetical protein